MTTSSVPALPGGPPSVSEHAAAVHERAIVVDGCSFFYDGYGELLRTGGVTATNYTVALPMDDAPDAMARIRDYYRAVARDPASEIVRTVDDVRRLKREGRYGVIIGCQNARLIGTDLVWLELFHRLGLRVLQLTYNERSFVGDGCLEPDDAGLSHFGRRVVAEANRLGVAVDLAHAGVRTAHEAIDASRSPCLITHGGVAALVPGPRSMGDDLLRALAARGGVFGVTSFPNVNWRGGDRRPSLDDYLEALEYAIDLVGIDHVGIGTDYVAKAGAYPDWVVRYLSETYAPYRAGRDARPGLRSVLGGIDIHDEQLEGFAGIHHLPRVTQALLDRGYAEDDVAKVLGGNFLRVFETVWGSDEARHDLG